MFILKPLFRHILFYLFHLTTAAQAQTISGFIYGSDGESMENVAVSIQETNTTGYSDDKGFYSLPVTPGKVLTIRFFFTNHAPVSYTFMAKQGESISYSPVMKLKSSATLTTVEVIDFKSRSDEMIHMKAMTFTALPSGSGNLEDLIKTQLGVSSNNELSAGYSVRGGNYDENLVYVNDIEVYRPFLVRSGQQEGLSFANPNMVQNISFSAGGFEARYGDKLSSVLDITYRKPRKFAGSASASLLGGNVQVEGVSKNHLVSWNIAARYRTNAYLLKSLETSGEYRPSSGDIQAFLTFEFTEKTKLEYLGNLSANRYLVIPVNRETNFGTVKEALKFRVYFDGRELMQYATIMNGLSLTHRPNKRTQLKLIASGYLAGEQEIYTIQGQYFIDQLEADFGKPNFGQVAYNRGVGTFLNNGRNYLNARVLNLEHKGRHEFNRESEFLWGARIQQEHIDDRLNEWRLIDSSGFLVPYSPTAINLIDVYKTSTQLDSYRSQAYFQYNYAGMLADSSNLRISIGGRANYWTLNQQLLTSPRLTIAWKPNWKQNWLFKVSTGVYYQPPFYRELRNIDGTVNKNVKAQRAIHYVASADYIFKMWDRPFKFIAAAYWKELNDLIAYEIDNVRIRYFANNATKGYATGMDLRINGEFIEGVESWATIGVLRTYEYSKNNIHYDYFNKAGEKIVKGYTFDQKATDSVKVDPGYIPRPTDQLVTFGMFFQDHLPRYPDIKFNLNLQFGSGLPFGPPTHLRWQQVLRMPPYRRADAGLAYNVLKESRVKKKKNAFNQLKELWVFLEVYNLLQVQNTVSYTWIQDVTGNRYAIPNYLTNRQINGRIQIRF